MSVTETRRNPVEMLAEDFAERLRAGKKPTIADYLESYPAYADEIEKLFPIIAALERAKLHRSGDRSSNASDASGVSLTVFGDYYIVREIGRGGMGVVYEARQRSLERRVALKVLPANYLPAAKHVLRFQREARSAARLHHTNIAPVFGVGQQDGSHYYVMQFIDGHSVDDVLHALRKLVAQPDVASDDSQRREFATISAAEIAELLICSKFAAESCDGPTRRAGSSGSHSPFNAERRSEGSPDSPARFSGFFVGSAGIQAESYYWRNIAGLGYQVARALQHAHDQGVLHRDIKPSNLMLDADGTAWVTDFGLAKIIGHDDLTDTRNTVGTLRYMAPEQLRGRGDARSDIYSLGLTLYELVTLRPAFAETNRARLVQRITQEAPQRPRAINRSIPRDLETVILKASAGELRNRYQTAGELADDLQRFLSGDSIRARATLFVEKWWRWCGRNSAIARMATAVSILLLTAASVGSIAYLRTTSALAQAANDRENALTAWHETERARRSAVERAALAEQQIEELERKLRELEQARLHNAPDR